MRKYTIALVGALVIAAIGFWIWLGPPDKAQLSVDAVTGRAPKITQQRNEMIETISIPKAVGWANGAKPTAAQGMAVQAFAGNLDHPSWLYRLPNGDILVAETTAPPSDKGGIAGFFDRRHRRKAGEAGPSANRITLLRDTNGDGRADQRFPFLTGLESPFGMALIGNALYVADTDAVLRFPYQAGETHIAATPEKIVDLPAGGDHWTRTLVANPADGTLWVTIGSATDLGHKGHDADPKRGRIMVVDPAKKTLSPWAWGIRAPVGMALNPTSGTLWAVADGRDRIGSDLPPDFLTEVSFGNFYGWPWYYWGGYVDGRINEAGPDGEDMREYSARPDYALGPHVGAMGLTFASDTALGTRFAQGAFVSEHGSTNRVPKSGYKVVFVPFGADGFPVPDAKPVAVLTGFLSADGDSAHGRPTGLATTRNGSLLVADDTGGTVWLVHRAG